MILGPPGQRWLFSAAVNVFLVILLSPLRIASGGFQERAGACRGMGHTGGGEGIRSVQFATKKGLLMVSPPSVEDWDLFNWDPSPENMIFAKNFPQEPDDPEEVYP